MTPTQRTLRELRQQGCVCEIVEKWIQHAGPHGIRKDLFGIIDVLCLDPQRGIVGVQSCGSSFSAHRRKLTVEKYQETRDWLEAGGKLELWGWRKVKVKRGGKAVRWQPRIESITLEDL